MFVNTLTTLRRPLAALALLMALVGGLAAPAAHAEGGLQSLAQIRAAAVTGLRRQLDPSLTGVALEAAPLDPRLRFGACPTALTTSALPPRGSQSRALVRVECAAAQWNINVPVEVRREIEVLVLRRAIARGETIAAADVAVQKRVLPGLVSPFVARVADLQGRITRRALPEGTAVSADALNAALLIHRGQNVTLAVQTAGIEVRAPGVALADAAARQRVRVQNLNSLKIVEGLAETEGVVRVSP